MDELEKNKNWQILKKKQKRRQKYASKDVLKQETKANMSVANKHTNAEDNRCMVDVMLLRIVIRKR